MKKIMLFAAFAVLSMGALTAQNTFKGTIIYKVESTGETAFQVPDQMATAELKVYDDKVLTSSKVFTNSPMINSILIDGRKQYMCWDLSMIFMYLSQNDVELDYQGSSKILAKTELTQAQIDSLTIPDDEGMYIEYVAGETKTIAGVTAKKAIIHVFGEEGDDHPIVVWYNDEMGPDVNLLFYGIRGIGLEYSTDLGEGRQLTLTATEVKKGKVKEVDMLLPSGYDTISDEDFKELFKQISEEMKYLQED
ncbi:MAG: hypothetical protein J6031_01120 [Bacteroidales bacterium]|nr:hypothetical protein [Bacteroidales bacterium]